MKSIWVLILSAATVTVCLHVRRQEPIVTPARHHEFTPEETAAPTPGRDIVVAPFNPGQVGARFQDAAPDPNATKRWNN